MAPAAGSGRRAGAGLPVVAIGYLLTAPPVFLIAPLVVTLAASRPASVREWCWLTVGSLWLGLWLAQPGDLAGQGLRALGVFATGGFLALSLVPSLSLFTRAFGATTLAYLALAAWSSALGVGWRDYELAIARDVHRGFSALGRAAAANGGVAADDVFQHFAEAAATGVRLAPSLVFVAAVAGLALGSVLVHRIASRPPVQHRPAPFASFRFSDHLVWLPVAGLAGVLLQLPAPANDVAANLLLVAVALYGARGLAVMVDVARLSRGAVVAIAIAGIVLLPFVLGGLALLGLADTWLDFRRRPVSPPLRGVDR